MRYLKLIIILFWFLMFGLSLNITSSAKAAECVPPTGPCPAGQVATDCGCVSNIGEYVNNLLNWVLIAVGGLAVVMFIYAGYMYVTSQGNPEALTKAKDIIIGVITGIILLFVIKLILVNTIGINTEVIQ